MYGGVVVKFDGKERLGSGTCRYRTGKEQRREQLPSSVYDFTNTEKAFMSFLLLDKIL